MTFTHKDWRLEFSFSAKGLSTPYLIIAKEPGGVVDNTFLQGIREALGYAYKNEGPVNISTPVQCYGGDWDTHLTPWLEMARRSDVPEYSQFTKTIIDWHDKALNAIADRLRNLKKDGCP